MIPYFGHSDVRSQLEKSLPVCTLLRGPESVGKWTLAEYLAQHHSYLPADVQSIPHLTMEAARDLKRFMSTAPFGHGKLALANLDGASESSLNGLLKLLEEPPRTAKFILCSSLRTLDTIASRSHVFGMGLLSEDDVRQILVVRTGMDPDAAWRAAELSRGQVTKALNVDEVEAAKARVLGVLKAIADQDRELFDATLSRSGAKDQPKDHKGPSLRWDDQCHQLLREWCVEAITGRWRVFTDAETFGLSRDKKMPRRILFALRANSRPQIAARVGLAPLLAERRRGA